MARERGNASVLALAFDLATRVLALRAAAAAGALALRPGRALRRVAALLTPTCTRISTTHQTEKHIGELAIKVSRLQKANHCQ